MKRSGWESVALVLSMAFVGSRVAHAEPPRSAPAPSSTLPVTVLPSVPELRLQWPISPLAFTFSGAELHAPGVAPLQLFSAQSLWLRTPALQLLTVGRAERAFELDCRLTCQPVVDHAVDLEARLPLPALLPSVGDAHAYLRSSSYYTSQSPQGVRLLSAGLAGVF